MQAIEFETYIKHSVIQLPLQFQNFDNVKAKVILLFYEPEMPGNYDKQNFLSSFQRAQQKGVFSNIGSSVSWQKQLRE